MTRHAPIFELSRALSAARHRAAIYVLFIVLAAGCRPDTNMVDQPRLEPYELSSAFDDGAGDRAYPEGTVSRDAPDFGSALEKPPLTLDTLKRGRERFDICCSVCHGRDGYGKGMVVERGFPEAASLHEERLRSAPDQHFFQVITNGRGNMPAYGTKVSQADRWAIIMYIRALQLSRNARLDDVPESMRRELTNARRKEREQP